MLCRIVPKIDDKLPNLDEILPIHAEKNLMNLFQSIFCILPQPSCSIPSATMILPTILIGYFT